MTGSGRITTPGLFHGERLVDLDSGAELKMVLEDVKGMLVQRILETEANSGICGFDWQRKSCVLKWKNTGKKAKARSWSAPGNCLPT